MPETMGSGVLALDFDAEFDAVFSNAALHWMRDADAVIAGVHRALRPGGRFVGEFGGAGNVAAITVALTAVLQRRGIDAGAAIPWFFPSAAEYRGRLERHGEARWPGDATVRMLAFGTTVDPADVRGFRALSLTHVTEFVAGYFDEHWEAVRHAHLKDPALGLLALLEQVRRTPTRPRRDDADEQADR